LCRGSRGSDVEILAFHPSQKSVNQSAFVGLVMFHDDLGGVEISFLSIWSVRTRLPPAPAKMEAATWPAHCQWTPGGGAGAP
jgi:hypothetical protein